MRKRRNSFHFEVKPEFCIVIAGALLVLPFRWVLAWVVASVIHELSHYAALRLSGCKVFRVQVDLNGAVMETDLLNCSKEIICALAGPFGGFALLLIAKWFPRLAICGCFQSLYNLIPIFPLDGGRIVRCILEKWLPENRGITVGNWVENGVLMLLLLLGGYASFGLKLGLLPLIFAVILIIKNQKIKFTCKARTLGVE